MYILALAIIDRLFTEKPLRFLRFYPKLAFFHGNTRYSPKTFQLWHIARFPFQIIRLNRMYSALWFVRLYQRILAVLWSINLNL